MFSRHQIFMQRAADLARADQRTAQPSVASNNDGAPADGSSTQSSILSAIFPDWHMDDLLFAWCALLEAPLWVLPASIASLCVVWIGFFRARYMATILDLMQAPAMSALLQSSSSTSGSADSPLAAAWAAVAAAVPSMDSPAGRTLAVLITLAAVDWVACVVRDYCFERARAARLLRSRLGYFAAMLRQDLAFHGGHPSTELAMRLSADPAALDDFVLFSLDRALRGASALATFAFMLRLDWQMTALGIALRLPFVFQFVEATVRIVSAYERLLADAAQRAQSRAVESLANIRVVQAATAERAELVGYGALLLEARAISASSAAVLALLRHTERVILSLSEIVTVAFGAWRIASGKLSLGALTALRSHIGSFESEFRELEDLYKSLRRATLQSRRYRSLLMRKPAVPLPLEPPSVPALEAALGHRVNISAQAGNSSAGSTAAASAACCDASGSSHGTLLAGASCSSSSGVVSKSGVAGQVRLERVWFSYSPEAGLSLAAAGAATNLMTGPSSSVAFDPAASHWVLRDISLAVPAGARVALVGTSGSGKTTLARLLLRFFDPSAGAVLLDGLPLSSRSTAQLRSAVAMVDQDTALLDRSVLENVLLGCPHQHVQQLMLEARQRGLGGPQAASDSSSAAAAMQASTATTGSAGRSSKLPGVLNDAGAAASAVAGYGAVRCPSFDEVLAASRLSFCHEFVSELPDGYCTRLGERGGRLSGGQRQRLVVLRAILRDPSVLVLDEATSALDAESEAIVNAALERLMHGRTTFVVAHRLASAMKADIICGESSTASS